MRLFRYGERGNERPGAYDRNGVRRNISGAIEDLSGQGLLPSLLAGLKDLDLEAFPQVPQVEAV